MSVGHIEKADLVARNWVHQGRGRKVASELAEVEVKCWMWCAILDKA